MNLAEKKCIACSGDVKAFDSETAQTFLKQLDNWTLSPDAKWLSKEFKFKNFAQALDFVNKVGAIAEDENHHPNIDFTWGIVKISIQTHKINGLFESDFILAAKIDRI